MVEHKTYKISNSWRIDSRFYLIEINERFYLIDYSNPKDFRNYLVPFFPETVSSWIAYDVTEEKDTFNESEIWKWFEKFKQMIFYFFLFFIINTMLFPQSLRLSQWTSDVKISQNWLQILYCIFWGIIVIICLLRLLTKEVQELQKYPTFILKKNSNTSKSKMNIILKGIILNLFTHPILLVIGIGGNNYIQLFLFGFIGIYCVLFIKFIEFQPIMERKKIYLKER